MATFQLQKYETQEETDNRSKVDESGNPIIEPPENKVREIKITELNNDNNLSSTIALTLIEALKQENLNLVQVEEPKNNLLKDIRIITMDDVEKDPVKSYQFANEGHAVILDVTKGFNTINERLFINNLSKDVKMYYSAESFILRKSFDKYALEAHKASQEAEILINAQGEEILLLKKFFVGDIISIKGADAKVTSIKDNHVAVNIPTYESEINQIYDYVVRSKDDLPDGVMKS